MPIVVVRLGNLGEIFNFFCFLFVSVIFFTIRFLRLCLLSDSIPVKKRRGEREYRSVFCVFCQRELISGCKSIEREIRNRRSFMSRF